MEAILRATLTLWSTHGRAEVQKWPLLKKGGRENRKEKDAAGQA